ncbi:hypothetical protein [Nocardia abscessus]|uniref:Uncharacterized protein n=1 Tax=Nocardia abscessus TaxID=120957 RepID=A0ABS0CDL8_9NOCA|nr:hypothetical protein [Nocardia abscessus]MBF6227582.1 hypothetical protein [Nocardia abscessus]MCC3327192.1 hypothetical protein [Nocardia abscessus]
MRIAIVSAGVLTVVAGAIAALGAGSAAAQPFDQVDQARLAIPLDHTATTALAGGPIPALVTMVIPPNRIGAGLKSDSVIHRDERGAVHATLRQVVLEAANHPDGTVTVYLNAPGARNGRVLDIYQHWN